MSSPQKIQANRRNARKSTGPRTQAGKDASRRNALRHGLCCDPDGLVLHDRDALALDAELARWVEHYQPDGPAEEALIRRAALASVRLDRCALAESAALASRRRHAEDDWRDGLLAEAAELDDRLEADPEAAARRLRRTPEGCDRLAARWRWLRNQADANHRWDDAEEALALGLARGLAGLDPEAFRRACDLTRDPEHRRVNSESHARALASREELTRGCDQALALIEDLKAGHAARWHDQERQEANLRALFDPGPEAALLRRYESAASQELHRSLDRLGKLRRETQWWDDEEDEDPEIEPMIMPQVVAAQSIDVDPRNEATIPPAGSGDGPKWPVGTLGLLGSV